MSPQQQAERRGFGVPGWIGESETTLSPCFVFGISQRGATLAVKDPSTLPENLRLYLSPTAQTFRRCLVRWRKEDSVGVQFEK
jgi:hypothetical protein